MQGPAGRQSIPALVMQLGQLQVRVGDASSREPEVDPPVPTTPPDAGAPPASGTIPPMPVVPPSPITVVPRSVRPQEGAEIKTRANRNKSGRRIGSVSYAGVARLPMRSRCRRSHRELECRPRSAQ